MKRVLTALLALSVPAAPALAATGPPVQAAAPGGQAAAGASRKLSLDVRMDRVWFGPGTPLAFQAELTSHLQDVASNLRVTVALYERVRSRGELRTAFEGKLPKTPLQAFTYRLDDLSPAASRTLDVQQPLESLSAFQDAPGGLYPLSVSVRQSTGPAIVSAVTAAAFMPSMPENPLQLVPVLVLAPEPLLLPGGGRTPRTRDNLAALRRSLSGLPVQNVPYGFAVSPVLLDEIRALRLSSLKSEAGALDESVSQLAQNGDVLTMPYAFAELPDLYDLDSATIIRGQLAAGRAALRRSLGADPTPLMYPPGLRVDARSLDAAGAEGITGTLLPGGATVSTSRGPTPADRVSWHGLELLAADDLLQTSLTRARNDIDVSRVVAETAMVYFESPSRQRAVAVANSDGAVPPRFASFLSDISGAPWLKLTAPTAALNGSGRVIRSLRLADAPKPPRAFTRRLSEARRAVADLAAFTFEGNPATAALRTALDVALGTAWWNKDWTKGTAWAGAVATAARRQRGRVSTAGAPITFTSRRGEVPITVVNRTSFPVRVRIDVTSPKLRFPEGHSMILDPLEPPGRTVTFPALAQATGTFPLKIRLTSPDGAVVVHEDELVVRSTGYNVVALAIIGSAALFLFLWYGRGLVSRRKRAVA